MLVTATAVACAPDPPSAVVGLVVDSCDPGVEIGSGMVVAPGLVLTSAHVVAGADGITIDQGGRSSAGEIVAFDPEMDLAYVAFDGVPTRPLPVGSDHIQPDDQGVAYVVRDGVIVELSVRVRRRVQLRTEDIYVQGETMRPGIELDAEIAPGDSGGAVVIDGRIVGVIWARSNRFDRRAYAIDAVRAADLIEQQRATGRIGDDIDVTRCH